MTGEGASADGDGRRRAQLVLTAAVVVVVALVPMALAYHQLGYRADVETTGPAPGATAERLLERAVANASGAVDGEYRWVQRNGAVARANESLAPNMGTIESSRADDGVLYVVERNGTAAADWAVSACPDGPGRRFGACAAEAGVVVQERSGETTLVAVAFDLRVRSERRNANLTLVIRPIRGIDEG